MKRILFLLSLPLIISSIYAQEREFYLWNNNKISFHLNEKVDFKLSNKNHFNTKASELDLFFYDLTMNFA